MASADERKLLPYLPFRFLLPPDAPRRLRMAATSFHAKYTRKVFLYSENLLAAATSKQLCCGDRFDLSSLPQETTNSKLFCSPHEIGPKADYVL